MWKHAVLSRHSKNPKAWDAAERLMAQADGKRLATRAVRRRNVSLGTESGFWGQVLNGTLLHDAMLLCYGSTVQQPFALGAKRSDKVLGTFGQYHRWAASRLELIAARN